MKNIVIITGASSGFGSLFATKLDERLNSIDEYWLIARNGQAMEELAKVMSTPCRILPYDLTDMDSVKEIIKTVEREASVCDEDVYVKMLINSAGYGKLGELVLMEDKDITGMIDLNIKALTMLCKGIAPYMSKNSRIINIASSAAFLPQPGFAEYAASKSYVLSLSRALNVELNKRGIYVTAVCPGPADTNFFTIAESDGASSPAYKKLFMADSSKVVDKAITDSINKAEVSVYGIWMNLFRWLCKTFPKSLILKFFR